MLAHQSNMLIQSSDLSRTTKIMSLPLVQAFASSFVAQVSLLDMRASLLSNLFLNRNFYSV